MSRAIYNTMSRAHSPTFPSLHLRHSSFSNPSLLHLCHSSFSNPSFASPASQALHLIHLASRPCNGSKSSTSDVEKGQILAYRDDGLSSREISRRINRSPSVVNNFFKLVLEYGTKKSSGRPRKLTERQECLVITYQRT